MTNSLPASGKLAGPEKTCCLCHYKAMTQRMLYLAAYDVAAPRRLRQALNIVKNFATGGQKSVYECFLDDREKQGLLKEVASVLDAQEDRFMLVRLDPRSHVRIMGIAVKPTDPEFYYVS